jgi:hypothetical protein
LTDKLGADKLGALDKENVLWDIPLQFSLESVCRSILCILNRHLLKDWCILVGT